MGGGLLLYGAKATLTVVGATIGRPAVRPDAFTEITGESAAFYCADERCSLPREEIKNRVNRNVLLHSLGFLYSIYFGVDRDEDKTV